MRWFARRLLRGGGSTRDFGLRCRNLEGLSEQYSRGAGFGSSARVPLPAVKSTRGGYRSGGKRHGERRGANLLRFGVAPDNDNDRGIRVKTMCFGVACAVMSACAVALATPAAAQAYPARAVRLIVPFSAGGAADVPARI